MGLQIEIEYMGRAPAGHRLGAARDGWVATIPRYGAKKPTTLTAPDGNAREVPGGSVVAVDLGGNGSVALLEADPDATESDFYRARLRVLDADGSRVVNSAHVIPSLRFEYDEGGGVLFGPDGMLWVSGLDVDVHGSIWLGLVRPGDGACVMSVRVPEPYPGMTWLYPGPSPESAVVYISGGQHGQWNYLVEREDDLLAVRRLSPSDASTSVCFFADGEAYAALEQVDYQTERLVVRSTRDASELASVELASTTGFPMSVWVDASDRVVVDRTDGTVDVLDRRLTKTASIALRGKLEGWRLDPGGVVVSPSRPDLSFDWARWRLVETS